jgi:hypothetical protein
LHNSESSPSLLEKKYARIEESLKCPASQLQQIKDSKVIRLKKCGTQESRGTQEGHRAGKPIVR